MSAAADLGGARPSNLFVAQWTLTMALPALLLAAVELVISIALPYEAMLVAALLPHFAVSLLIAYLQFRLLKGHMLRRVLWLATTFAASVIGGFVASMVIALLQTTFDAAVAGGEGVSDWARTVYPWIPYIFAELAAAAILGLAQLACFDDVLAERVSWFCASIAAGLIAASAGAAVSIGTMRWLPSAAAFDVISTPVMFGIVPLLIATVADLALYGLLMGLVMKKLLTRRASLQRASLIGQFE